MHSTWVPALDNNVLLLVLLVGFQFASNDDDERSFLFIMNIDIDTLTNEWEELGREFTELEVSGDRSEHNDCTNPANN